MGADALLWNYWRTVSHTSVCVEHSTNESFPALVTGYKWEPGCQYYTMYPASLRFPFSNQLCDRLHNSTSQHNLHRIVYADVYAMQLLNRILVLTFIHPFDPRNPDFLLFSTQNLPIGFFLSLLWLTGLLPLLPLTLWTLLSPGSKRRQHFPKRKERQVGKGKKVTKCMTCPNYWLNEGWVYVLGLDVVAGDIL